jgi:hypothetical protein
MPKLTPDSIRASLNVMARSLGVAVRRHAHPQHRGPLDGYVRFIGQLERFITHLETTVTSISTALNKVEAERDAWKTYAQNQKTKADQADRARQAAEDKLAAMPLQADAEDAAAVNGVIAAADDLPPAETPTTLPDGTPIPA